MSLNDIPSNSCRIKIAGKDPDACDLFFTNILEILIEHMLGFDMKSKLPKQKGGFFGVPQAFAGGIESQGKGTLHVHMIVFLAGFPRDSDEMVKMMVEDKSFKEILIKYFSSVVYCSALDEEHIMCPSCGNNNSLEAVDICETAYMSRSRKCNPPGTSQCANCRSLFGGDEVLHYSINEMIEKMNRTVLFIFH